jgi:hypothetical protein
MSYWCFFQNKFPGLLFFELRKRFPQPLAIGSGGQEIASLLESIVFCDGHNDDGIVLSGPGHDDNVFGFGDLVKVFLDI